jgi:addiction module RelB/DinJ family antitoxin
MAQTSMTFRVDNALKRNFDILCNEFGFSSTAAITVFMKTVVRERKIPFEYTLPNICLCFNDGIFFD